MNRIANAVARMKAKIADRIAKGLTTEERVAETCKALDLDLMEFITFQEIKSLAFASGKITQAEAQYVYRLLGSTPDHFNRQDVAAKAVLTTLFKELMEARVR